MKKIIAGVMGFLMIGMVVVEAEAASRVSSSSRSYSSSRSSSFSSSPSRSSYSAPKSYSAPAASAPSRSTSSNPGLKALGFSKPASTPTVSRPSASVSSSRPAPTSTVSTGWFGKKSVSSAPVSYRAPVRQVSSPVQYRNTLSSRPRTTVIQRNTYVNYGGYNGYNRGYGGYGYNPYGGYGYGGNSFVSGALGAVGGVMLYNALTTPHHTSVNSGATAAQIEQAKTDQRIEDKLDMQNQLLMQQRNTQTVAAAPVVMQQPQCFLPPDAPLMMSPQFYCGVNNAEQTRN
ncbi:hypothetical protein VCM_00160 [Pseudomonas phage VCM]|uniref:Uncharacterized protein n=1 Tax=Pseudomonas phage VCM TaxID=1729937 RepID=A0A0S4KWG1_9CAUD|nr:hypothetical protein VCM_00160 [Pseudomonas phage VCM]CUR44362.1 hypothetical protein VCM_00160 [Pseudomonas phage VCM]